MGRFKPWESRRERGVGVPMSGMKSRDNKQGGRRKYDLHLMFLVCHGVWRRAGYGKKQVLIVTEF